MIASGSEIEEKLSSEISKLRGDVKTENDRLERLKSSVNEIEEKKGREMDALKEIGEEIDSRKEDIKDLER